MKTLYDIEAFLKREHASGSTSSLMMYHSGGKFYVSKGDTKGSSAHLDDALDNLAEEFRRKDAALKSMRAPKQTKTTTNYTGGLNWVTITTGAGGTAGGVNYPVCGTCGQYPTSLYARAGNPHIYEFFCRSAHSWQALCAPGNRMALDNGDSYEYNGFNWVRVP